MPCLLITVEPKGDQPPFWRKREPRPMLFDVGFGVYIQIVKKVEIKVLCW
jgi:hypothetical protein